MAETVLFEHGGEGISTIRINRPPLNLLDEATTQALIDAFDEANQRDATRCVIFCASGDRAFSGGHDMGADDGEPGAGLETIDKPGGRGRVLTEKIETLSKPVVCGARGWIVGGPISLVLASDVRIISETARFRYVDVKRGLAPSWGLTLARMVHFIGRNHTLDLLLGPEDVGAQRAYELGLVTAVTPDSELEQEVQKAAEHLAKGAPLTVQAIKAATYAQYTRPFPEVQAVQDEWVTRLSSSKDAVEGMQAFFERREPHFSGT